MNKSQKTDIGRRLWAWMLKNPCSAWEIADMIGISRATLLNIVRDKYEPRTKTRCLIEKFLHENSINNEGDII